jgi:hypothetical protein
LKTTRLCLSSRRLRPSNARRSDRESYEQHKHIRNDTASLALVVLIVHTVQFGPDCRLSTRRRACRSSAVCPKASRASVDAAQTMTRAPRPTAPRDRRAVANWNNRRRTRCPTPRRPAPRRFLALAIDAAHHCRRCTTRRPVLGRQFDLLVPVEHAGFVPPAAVCIAANPLAIAAVSRQVAGLAASQMATRRRTPRPRRPRTARR